MVERINGAVGPVPHTKAEIHRRALFAVEAESVGGRPAGCFDDLIGAEQTRRGGGDQCVMCG